MLKFDRFLCLVTDHMHSPCRECVDVCYTNAFTFNGEKIVLNDELCTNCAACVGGCPTEAISFEEFEPSRFVLTNEDSNLSCRSNTPCLAIFSAEHLVVLAKEQKISCDLSGCESCEINKDNKVLDLINSRIIVANDLLAQLDLDLIDTAKEMPKSSRREFFIKLAKKTRDVIAEPETMVRSEFHSTPTPKYKLIFQNRLKNIEKDLKSPLFHTRAINDNCIACSECTRICPTKALFWLEESLAINSSKCVDCSLCEMVCKDGAIDKVEFASSKPYLNGGVTTLKKFQFVECEKCGTPFVQAQGKTMCPQCDVYYAEFADMFTPAYKLER